MNKNDFTELYNWAKDSILVWLLPSVFAAITKIAYSMKKNKRVLTWTYIFTSIIIASFVGYWVNLICVNTGQTHWAGAIVALCAIASDTILKMIMEKEFLLILISKLTGLKFENKEKGGENELP